MLFCEFRKIFNKAPQAAGSVKYEYAVNARFTQGLLQLLLTSLVKKHLNEHIIYYNFSVFIEKRFYLSSLLHNLNYLMLLNSFLFLTTFSLKSLNDYFFQMACLHVSLVLINCTMWYSYLFSTSSSFQSFSWSRFFTVQVFQNP